jgi:hypothetical protein
MRYGMLRLPDAALWRARIYDITVFYLTSTHPGLDVVDLHIMLYLAGS